MNTIKFLTAVVLGLIFICLWFIPWAFCRFFDIFKKGEFESWDFTEKFYNTWGDAWDWILSIYTGE